MTDIAALAKRLRKLSPFVVGDICEDAADALEAQAKEIDDLKNLLMEALERAGDD